MSYEDLSPITYSDIDVGKLEKAKNDVSADKKIAGELRTIQPAFLQITEEEQLYVIRGTYDQLLHECFRQLGKDPSSLEFYLEINSNGNIETIKPNDSGRVLNSQDTRKFARKLHPVVEKALDEYLSEKGVPYKARVKEFILKFSLQAIRLLLNSRITKDTVKSAKIKLVQGTKGK